VEIGQVRALNAIDFGLNLDSKGFNIYVLGENGTGKSTTIKAILKKKAGVLIFSTILLSKFRA
jgi:ABC-type Mn2+/Zn2+ transport system ATPase subunit